MSCTSGSMSNHSHGSTAQVSSTRSIARDHAGNDRDPAGRAPRVGRIGPAAPRALFPQQPQHQIQPHVSAQNALGARAAGIDVHRGTNMTGRSNQPASALN